VEPEARRQLHGALLILLLVLLHRINC
jgi:hypothetical protein